eukprot:457937-Alexandrium_andersonii.AAC.1
MPRPAAAWGQPQPQSSRAAAGASVQPVDPAERGAPSQRCGSCSSRCGSHPSCQASGTASASAAACSAELSPADCGNPGPALCT